MNYESRVARGNTDDCVGQGDRVRLLSIGCPAFWDRMRPSRQAASGKTQVVGSVSGRLVLKPTQESTAFDEERPGHLQWIAFDRANPVAVNQSGP
jgi:hypothetical protein